MMKPWIFLFFLSCCLQSYTALIECEHFKKIYECVDAETLIILDIDDTLLVPAQMLGCDEWFMSRLQYHQQSLSYSNALEKALAEWEGIRHLTKMILVEPNTDQHIHMLQKKGYTLMGLTTQGLALATRTNLQLKEHNIDLSLSAPCSEDRYFSINHHGILYRNGILFTSGQSKADSLAAFCQSIDYMPKKIVFINDKASHLKDLERFALKNHIEYVGLRYGFSDFRKKAFSLDVANYQFHHSSCEDLLSDEKAAEALQLR